MKFHFTVETGKKFVNAVNAVVSETERMGYRVLYIHDVHATLKEKGFDIPELKIIEVCNAKHANSLLQKNLKTSLFMPCRISVYVQNDKTYISAMNTKMIAQMVPELDFAALAEQVNTELEIIVNNAH